MRRYLNKPIGELAAELTAGLVRLRKGYVDSAEAFSQIIDTTQEYPYDFVVYRLTGYRPPGGGLPGEMMDGKGLRADLLQLMLDLCDSFELATGRYSEKVYDIRALARRFNVSAKTIQRWRRRGLPARRLRFPDGKKRMAFLESSVNRFTRARHRQVARSMRFSQLTEAEREDIVRRAKRMASSSHCSLSEVARRIASRTGRAAETVRYTIRRHDMQHPADAAFPRHPAPLDEREKARIYRSFLRGVPAPALGEHYRRSRGSIYRIVNEMRVRNLMERNIACIFNPQFNLPNADEVILGTELGRRPASLTKRPKFPVDLPPYLKALYDVPLLSPEQERDLFRRYNYLKHKANTLRRQMDQNRVRMDQLKRVESLLLAANAVKNRIIRANLRLVVSIAKKHAGGPMTLFELISDGNVSLMRAVEKFDYSRGYRFSTYASWAIMRNFARTVPRERYQLDRFATGHDEILDIAASLRIYNPNEVNLPELRESIDVLLARLSPLERSILVDHYGLDDAGNVKTLDQLGKYLGLSKERVRQIEIKALKKLRGIMRPQELELLA